MTEMPPAPDIYDNFAAWTADHWRQLAADLDSTAALVAIRFTEVSRALTESQQRTLRPWSTSGISSVDDFRILGLLRHIGDEGIRLNQIAEHLRFEPGTTSSRVARLEKHGFIERVDNPNDRRSRFVRLTVDRANDVDEMYRALVANHEQFFSGLGEGGHAALAALLAKI